jgi:hypothetical protein
MRAPDAPPPRPCFCLCPRTDVRYRRLVSALRPGRVASADLALARSWCSPELSPPPCGEAHLHGSCGYSGRFRGSRRQFRGYWRRTSARVPGWSHQRRAGLMSGGLRRRTTGPLPGALRPARVAERDGERHRAQVGGQSGADRRQRHPGFLRPPAAERSGGFHRGRPTARPGARHRLRENAACAGSPRRRGPWSALARGPARMSGSSGAGRRRLASEDHVGYRRRSRCRDRCVVLARRDRRPCGRGRSSPSHWSRSAAGSSAGSSMFRRQHEPSSGHRGPYRCDRCRLPLGPWAFRVPQPRQPTSSICHHRTQTNEEGRSTSSGATLFTYVRRRPTLPRGPPRSTIGAEGLNFRVRNGTGCFPFAITAVTLLRCHRPA